MHTDWRYFVILRRGLGDPIRCMDLINQGYDINESPIFRGALQAAIHNKNTECIEVFIEAGANLNIMDENSQTPLHVAAGGGHDDYVVLFLEKGSNINIRGDDDGYTALHYAARYGHIKCVQLLLNYGADVDILDADGNSPLDLAIKYNHKKVTNAIGSHKFKNIKGVPNNIVRNK